MTLIEEQGRLMALANTHLTAIPWGEAWRESMRAFNAALPGDEPLEERTTRAMQASNDVWRAHLERAGVTL